MFVRSRVSPASVSTPTPPVAPYAVGTQVGVPTGTSLTTTSGWPSPDSTQSVTITNPITGATNTRNYQVFQNRRWAGDLALPSAATPTNPYLLKNCRIEGRFDPSGASGEVDDIMRPVAVLERCTIDGGDLSQHCIVEGYIWTIGVHGTGASDGWGGPFFSVMIDSQFIATTDGSAEPHSDAAQIAGGTDCIAWHCWLDAGQVSTIANSPFRLGNEFGGVARISIMHSGLSGSQHGLQFRGDSCKPAYAPAQPMTAIRVEGCRFQPATQYGASNINGMDPVELTWVNNAYYDGTPIAKPSLGVGDWQSSLPSVNA